MATINVYLTCAKVKVEKFCFGSKGSRPSTVFLAISDNLYIPHSPNDFA